LGIEAQAAEDQDSIAGVVTAPTRKSAFDGATPILRGLKGLVT